MRSGSGRRCCVGARGMCGGSTMNAPGAKVANAASARVERRQQKERHESNKGMEGECAAGRPATGRVTVWKGGVVVG